MSVPVATSSLVDRYLLAKQVLIRQGYAQEISWQENVSLSSLTEQGFLREAAWVVLSTGMRESVIRGLFDRVSEAFLCWESACRILREKETCRALALNCFRNQRKIDAIIGIAEIVDSEGFERLKARISEYGTEVLQDLPYIGPTTSYHLAKNIGLDVAKPDRHLQRVAAATGFDTPSALCAELAEAVGDRKAVVDIVIWRFATIYGEYLSFFSEECHEIESSAAP